MKVHVNQDACISCGLCVSTCNDVFDWNDDEKAHSKVDEVPAEFEEAVHEAVDSCPTEAIESED